MPSVDCHQHVWSDALVEALRARSQAPFLDGDRLHLDGEPPFELDRRQHDVGTRRARDAADGIDLTVLSLSSPLGIETLPPDQAAPLLDAWHAQAPDLGVGHGLWAAVNLVEPDLGALAAHLRTPAVRGLQLPATALADPHALERLAPVLEVLQDADRPLLVHPGPAPSAVTSTAAADLPGWWPALTSYPAQQAAAWFAWHVAGRALLPRLRVAFVALAGLAPLHHERLAQRGGSLGALDPNVFYETSSYGVRALDAMARVVGIDQLVHGSDLPYAQPLTEAVVTATPGLGAAFAQALFVVNPHHLLEGGHP